MTEPKTPSSVQQLKERITGQDRKIAAQDAKITECAWYIAELNYVLKALVAQAMQQQMQPVVEAQLREQIMSRLDTNGVGGLLSGAHG